MWSKICEAVSCLKLTRLFLSILPWKVKGYYIIISVPTCHVSTYYHDKCVKMLHAHTPFMTNVTNIKHPAMFPVLNDSIVQNKQRMKTNDTEELEKKDFFLAKPANISGFVFLSKSVEENKWRLKKINLKAGVSRNPCKLYKTYKQCLSYISPHC